MEKNGKKNPVAVIACGGSGGHFYPGLAVAQKLYDAGCEIVLVVTEKEVDQVVSGSVRGMRVERMPAIGLTSAKRIPQFTMGFLRSYFKAKRLFKEVHPSAVLGMGGFSSAPTVLAAGCKAFIHEGNSIPGRANRLVAPFVHTSFVHFEQSAARLRSRRVEVTGMPVRGGFAPIDEEGARGCRMALGLDPDKPVLLVMGGSQGAHAVNQLVRESIKKIRRRICDLQIIHLTGKKDFEEIKKSYEKKSIPAQVHEYFGEMELVMGAATVMVSRAGASSLAEIARMRIASVLVPLPSAADNHQYYNALAFEEKGAAAVFEQDDSGNRSERIDDFADTVSNLLRDEKERASMKTALGLWGQKDAAAEVARKIIEIAMPGENLNTDWSTEPIL